MTRAGREPAEDVKRRLEAACEEVGLAVAYATMHLLPNGGDFKQLQTLDPAKVRRPRIDPWAALIPAVRCASIDSTWCLASSLFWFSLKWKNAEVELAG